MPVSFRKRLGHEACLQAHLGVAHLAVDLGFGHQGGHGIHHDDIDGAAAHQGFGDLQGLLAGVRLRDEQLVGLDPELLRIDRVEGMLGIDKGGDAARLVALRR